MHAGFCVANCACVGAELQQRADSARITHGAAFAALIIWKKTLSTYPLQPLRLWRRRGGPPHFAGPGAAPQASIVLAAAAA